MTPIAHYGNGMIAIPAQDQVHTRFCSALLELERSPGTEVVFNASRSGIIGKRNDLLQMFLHRPHLRWILWLDSDMVPEPWHLRALLETCQSVVAGWSVQRYPVPLPIPRILNPDNTVTFVELDTPGPEVMPCTTPGCGFLLVHRNVIERLQRPWFYPFMVEDPVAGEDYPFAMRCVQAGFQPHVHRGVQVGHLQMVPLVESWRIPPIEAIQIQRETLESARVL